MNGGRLGRIVLVGTLVLGGCGDDATGNLFDVSATGGDDGRGSDSTSVTTGATVVTGTGAASASSDTMGVVDDSTTAAAVDSSSGGPGSDTTATSDTTDGSTDSGSTDSGSTGSGGSTGMMGGSTDGGSSGMMGGSTDGGSSGTMGGSTDGGSTGMMVGSTGVTSTTSGVMSTTSSSSGGTPEVGFGDCATQAPNAACLPDEFCITDDPLSPGFGVCAREPCTSSGDCPDVPPGGDAGPLCGDITGDGLEECFIDCSVGQNCPTGMECWLGTACVWPIGVNTDEGYGDCINQVPLDGCLSYETCLFDDPLAPSVGVCGYIDCGVPSDCPVAPPGGTAPVSCIDVTGDFLGDCFINCANGDTCPTGMSCSLGFLCAWDPDPAIPQVGYGDCLNNGAGVACWADEACLSDNPAAPTVAACSEGPCNVAADCRDAPPGGTAPVTCADVTGDLVGECYLDCAGGGTCPTGMQCFGGFVCLWPDEGATPGGDCCDVQATGGCSVGSIEACVCGADPFCCTNAWDQLCVDAVPGCNGICP